MQRAAALVLLVAGCLQRSSSNSCCIQGMSSKWLLDHVTTGADLVAPSDSFPFYNILKSPVHVSGPEMALASKAQ